MIDLSGALLWIVLLPLFGAIINGLAGRSADKQLVGGLAVGSVAGAFLISVLGFLELASGEGHETRIVQDVYEWFTLHFPGRDGAAGFVEVPIRFRLVLDSLSAVMALVVTGIGLLIHIYALGYMSDDPGFPRFFTYLNLFMASMLVLVLASNIPLMFVGWEGVGLCSYLLIGFWFENEDYAKAGRKAFVMNRIGDFGVLIGMFILVVATGSFEFSEINTSGSSLRAPFELPGVAVSSLTVATAACLFLFLGCTGKSAQIPLYTWLPDAMAGPTPVSALIHAATMVTAGVYLCCRLSPVFVLSPTAMAVIAVVGALTALFAASIALVQNQMKKILAYSTVSQLGFMFAAVGVGAFTAGIFHVFTHAFFKACLFLGAGSVMHAVGAHGDADVKKLGGLRSVLPTTHWTFLVSCLAIAGVPLFSGFFSKDEILLGATALGLGGGGGHGAEAVHEAYYSPAIALFVFVVLTVAATMTAFYMFRLYFLTFAGDYRSAAADEGRGEDDDAIVHDDHAHGHGYDAHPHESPLSMTVPLMVLGLGAIFAGFVGLPGWTHLNVWNGWLHDTVATLPGHGHHESLDVPTIAALVAGTVAMALGIGLAYSLYGKGQTKDPLSGGFHQLLMDKWRIDELYDAIVVRPIQMLARLSAYIDQAFVDGVLARLTASLVQAMGWLLTRLQTGVVYAYGAIMTLGIGFVAWWFLYPHASVQVQSEGDTVAFTAAPGLGYEYRWDVDADGEFESEFSPGAAQARHDYGGADRVAFVARITMPRTRDVTDLLLLPDRPVTIPTDVLAVDWTTPETEGVGLPPALRFEDGRVELRANSARVSVSTTSEPEEEGVYVLQEGRGSRIGGARVVLLGVVRASVEVRSAFGNVARKTFDVVLDPEATAPQVAVASPRGER